MLGIFLINVDFEIERRSVQRTGTKRTVAAGRRITYQVAASLFRLLDGYERLVVSETQDRQVYDRFNVSACVIGIRSYIHTFPPCFLLITRLTVA